MAIEANTLSTRMQLKLVDGVDDQGNDIIRTKTYSNVNADATDEDFYDIAEAISALQTKNLAGVHKVVDVVLIEV
ncbi:MAG: DUF1659 domain-containing protein [Eubacteriales bacterium]